MYCIGSVPVLYESESVTIWARHQDLLTVSCNVTLTLTECNCVSLCLYVVGDVIYLVNKTKLITTLSYNRLWAQTTYNPGDI
jgi:hypothetical protein